MKREHTDPLEIIPCETPTSKRFRNLIGLKVGRLTVLELFGKRQRTARATSFHYFWKCICQCGQMTVVDGSFLGHQDYSTKSCGCLISENVAVRQTTHGLTWSPEYRVWSGMLSRCRDKNNHAWDNYGGRGILVCERWWDFMNFIADMGPRPTLRHTIERRNNNGNYQPDNCYWATFLQQARNRRGLHMVTLDGQEMCISEWAERVKLPFRVLFDRLRRGWTPRRALTTPMRLKKAAS